MQQLKFVNFNVCIGIFDHPELGQGLWVTDMQTYNLFKGPYKLTAEPIKAKYLNKTLYYLWPNRNESKTLGGNHV